MGTWEISTKESAFRRCGYDMVHCFNSTGWALCGQVDEATFHKGSLMKRRITVFHLGRVTDAGNKQQPLETSSSAP